MDSGMSVGELMGTNFRVLGDVEVVVDGRVVDVGHPRQRGVLAVLLIEPNRAVLADQLLDRVWADRLPRRANATLSGYMSRLRRVLEPATCADLARRGGGYALTVDPLAVDLHRFRHLVAEARITKDSAEAVGKFERALGLWRGDALATLDTPWLNTVRDGLHAERLAAELDRNDLALAASRHGELLPDLTARSAAYPLDERLAGQLLLALYRAGRQAEALRHYEGMRRRLADDVGADPSPALQLLHKRILTADPALGTVDATATSQKRPVPRQLPPPPRPFIGRVSALEALDATLVTAEAQPMAMPVAVVCGAAGVGKTALALQWAHQVADRFSDGQLYVNLRGFDPAGSALDPAEALRMFLDAYGIPPEWAASVEAQTALYRSHMAGRRVLIVLDNARDTEQVRPLLPGTGSCMVLVTSRDQLTGLVAGVGAHPVPLDLFSATEARDLLAGRLGTERVATEPKAVNDMVAGCARLPLALTIAAARAAAHPDFPLATFAAELTDAAGGLDALDGGDPYTDARAVFSWSCRALSNQAARLFRLLGLHPGPDVSVAAVASLVGLSSDRVRPLLAELTRAHLVIEHAPGRYGFHDLLRAYAVEQVRDMEPDIEQHQARHRLLDHYLHAAYLADRLIPQPDRVLGGIAPEPPQAGVTLEHIADFESAMAWLVAEQAVLLAAVDQAAVEHFDPHAWHLAWRLCTFLERRGSWHARAAMLGTALAAATRLEDRSAQATIHCALGISYGRLGQHNDANRHLRQSLDLYRALGIRNGEAAVLVNLSWSLHRLGRMREALPPARQALDLYRAADGAVSGEGVALNNIAWSHAQLGELEQARTYCQQAIELHRSILDRSGEATALDSLGYIHRRAGHLQKAVDAYEHAHNLFRELGDRQREAETLERLGDTHLDAEHPDAARHAWRLALRILIELGDPAVDQLHAKIDHLATPSPSGTACRPDQWKMPA